MLYSNFNVQEFSSKLVSKQGEVVRVNRGMCSLVALANLFGNESFLSGKIDEREISLGNILYSTKGSYMSSDSAILNKIYPHLVIEKIYVNVDFDYETSKDILFGFLFEDTECQIQIPDELDNKQILSISSHLGYVYFYVTVMKVGSRNSAHGIGILTNLEECYILDSKYPYVPKIDNVLDLDTFFDSNKYRVLQVGAILDLSSENSFKYFNENVENIKNIKDYSKEWIRL